MKLIPHHQHDKNGRREYRSPDETWRVVRTRRPGGNRNERPRWEVHERHEDHADWHCHAAFERRRDALVFLDTPAATPGGESRGFRMSKQPRNLNAVFGRFRRRMLAAELPTGAVERRDTGNASEPARRTMPATLPDPPPRACQSGRLASTSPAGASTPCAVSSVRR